MTMAQLRTVDLQETFDACLKRDWSGALEAINTARTSSDVAASSLLLKQLSIYASNHLAQQQQQQQQDDTKAQSHQGLYDSGEAFARFIEGFGNEQLYADCTRAMARIYHLVIAQHQQQPEQSNRLSLFDIGVGNGRALLPALEELSGDSIKVALDIIDPSSELLAECTTKLEKARQESKTTTIEFESSISTIQEYLDTQPSHRHWDVVQSTFALHNLAPSDRVQVFRQLHSRASLVFVIEFDTYSRADPRNLEPYTKAEKLDYTLERYERALQLYQHESNYDLVVQGFLLPIMLGYFDATAPTATFEQPLQAWVEEYRLAGFEHVEYQVIHQYWWGDAGIVVAQHQAPTTSDRVATQ